MKHKIKLNLDFSFVLLQKCLQYLDCQSYVNTHVQEIGSLQRKIRNIGRSQENKQLEQAGHIAIIHTQGSNKE
jgi:hypothetical protein